MTLHTKWHFGWEEWQIIADYLYTDIIYMQIISTIARRHYTCLTTTFMAISEGHRTGLNNVFFALHQFLGRIVFQCSCYNIFVSLTTKRARTIGLVLLHPSKELPQRFKRAGRVVWSCCQLAWRSLFPCAINNFRLMDWFHPVN